MEKNGEVEKIEGNLAIQIIKELNAEAAKKEENVTICEKHSGELDVFLFIC